MAELKILAWFGTLAGRLTLIAAITGGVFGWVKWHADHHQNIGVRKEQVRVETVGKKIDGRAQQKRERVQNAPPSEVDAALRRYCRDCGK